MFDIGRMEAFAESDMKIGVLGSCEVAIVLATGFLKHGHDATLTPPAFGSAVFLLLPPF